MARDDYFVIAYKILAYLNECLTHDAVPDMNEIGMDSIKLDISRTYWNYVMLHLLEDGLIEGAHKVTMGDTYGIKLAPDFNITPKGIAYLRENSTIKEVERFIGNPIVRAASGLIGLKL